MAAIIEKLADVMKSESPRRRWVTDIVVPEDFSGQAHSRLASSSRSWAQRCVRRLSPREQEDVVVASVTNYVLGLASIDGVWSAAAILAQNSLQPRLVFTTFASLVPNDEASGARFRQIVASTATLRTDLSSIYSIGGRTVATSEPDLNSALDRYYNVWNNTEGVRLLGAARFVR